MQTEVSILHHDYPSRVRDHVETKLQGLHRFFDRVISMRARLEREKDDHRVEIVANVGRGTPLVVEATGEAFKAALEEATDRMARLLKKHNAKLTHERRRVGRPGH